MNTSSVGLAVIVGALASLYACSAQQTARPNHNNTGGTGSGATSGTGQAGTYGTSGASGTYGTSGASGTVGTAGASGTLGTAGASGSLGTAGKAGAAGASGSLGTSGTGAGGAGAAGAAGAGTSGTGASGTSSTAGAAGAAGSGSVSCDAAFAVGPDGFVRAPAYGGACWHGYAFLGGDTTSTIAPKDFGSCGAACKLTLTGTVGAAVAPAYAGNAYLGFNLNQASGATATAMVTPTGTSLKVSFTGSFAGMRVQVVAGSTFWCAPVTTSPATVPYAMLNTACWDNSGTYYMKQPITSVQLSLPGAATATAAVSVTLDSVTEL